MTSAATKATTRERAIADLRLTIMEAYSELLRAWKKTRPQSVAELYAAQESLGEQAKALYDVKDLVLKKLVRVWKKAKRTPVDDSHVLEIEDSFRGQTKAFAPAFAHRYKLKLKTVQESE